MNAWIFPVPNCLVSSPVGSSRKGENSYLRDCFCLLNKPVFDAKFGVRVTVVISLDCMHISERSKEMKLHVRNGPIIDFEVRQSGIGLSRMKVLYRCDIKLPVTKVNRLSVVSREWRTGNRLCGKEK